MVWAGWAWTLLGFAMDLPCFHRFGIGCFDRTHDESGALCCSRMCGDEGVHITSVPMWLFHKFSLSAFCVCFVFCQQPSQIGPPCHIWGKHGWTCVPRRHFGRETPCHNALGRGPFQSKRCCTFFLGNKGIRTPSVRSPGRSAVQAPAHVLDCVRLVVCSVSAPVPGLLIYGRSSCWGRCAVERVSDLVLLAFPRPCLGHALALRSHVGLPPRFLCCALSDGCGSIAGLFGLQ